MRFTKSEAFNRIKTAFQGYEIEFKNAWGKDIHICVFLDPSHITCTCLPVITYANWKSPDVLDEKIIDAKKSLSEEIERLREMKWKIQ